MERITRYRGQHLVKPHAGQTGPPEQLANQGYLLQALGVLGGIPAVVGLIRIYTHFAQARGRLAESHFRYQIRTFWGGLVMLGVGLLTTPWYVGFFILGFAGLWYFYRVVRGWSTLTEGDPMLV